MIALFTEFTLRLRIWFYTAALSQIDPLHADVPEIIRTLCALCDQLDELKGQS